MTIFKFIKVDNDTIVNDILSTNHLSDSGI